MAIKLLNGLFLVVYLMSAAVQYNDSDAVAWILIYLAAVGMCIAQLRRRLPRPVPVLLLVISLLWIVTLLPGVIGQVSPQEIFDSITMKTRAVEEAREIGGLTLVAIWAAVLTLQPGR